MRFLIAGAGAVGAYMGARMARAGLDVTLFARGQHLQAIQERGVRVVGAEDDFEARPHALDRLQPSDSLRCRLPHREGARPAAACAATADCDRSGDHGCQHAERHSLVVLSGRRRRTGRPSAGARRSRRRGFRRHSRQAGRRLDHLLRHRHRRARRHSPHRGQPHLARRAGRHALRARPQDCRRADRLRPALSDHHPYPAGDLGQDSRQRGVQSHQRAHRGNAGADGAPSRSLADRARGDARDRSSSGRSSGSNCPSPSSSASPAPPRSASTRPPCCRTWRPGRPLELDAIVGAVVELGERLKVPMPHTRTIYACTKLLSEVRSGRRSEDAGKDYAPQGKSPGGDRRSRARAPLRLRNRADGRRAAFGPRLRSRRLLRGGMGNQAAARAGADAR